MAENLTHALVRHLDFGRPPSAAFEPSALTDNTSTSSATREAAAGALPPGTQRAKVRRTLWASRTRKPEASSEWRPSFRPRHSDRCDSSPQARPFDRFSNIPFFCGRPHMRDGQRFGNLHNVKILLRNHSPGDHRGTSPVDGDFLGPDNANAPPIPERATRRTSTPNRGSRHHVAIFDFLSHANAPIIAKTAIVLKKLSTPLWITPIQSKTMSQCIYG